jgi:hypothetical protein
MRKFFIFLIIASLFNSCEKSNDCTPIESNLVYSVWRLSESKFINENERNVEWERVDKLGDLEYGYEFIDENNIEIHTILGRCGTVSRLDIYNTNYTCVDNKINFTIEYWNKKVKIELEILEIDGNKVKLKEKRI